MARLLRGCPTPQSQQDGTEEPETNPMDLQQEKQPDATEGKVMADYRMSQSLRKKKRKTPTQNIRTWRHLAQRFSTIG